MGRLVKSGVEVSETSFVPYFLYVGDTDISIFTKPNIKDKNKWLLMLWFIFIAIRIFLLNFS